MKKRLLLFGMAMSLMTISCSKDDATTSGASSDVVANQKVDAAIDDVAIIAEDQFEADQSNASGRGIQDYTTELPDCAHVSFGAANTLTHRVIIITFGGTAAGDFCLFRGHHLRGKIILIRDITTNELHKEMSITYDGFYVDDNKLEGTTVWTRDMVGTGTALHPKHKLTMTNMTLTTSAGAYVRNGHRTREMTAGFSTRNNHQDDEFITYGEFNTTHPDGTYYVSYISQTSPLLTKTACEDGRYPVSGVLYHRKQASQGGVVLRTTTIDYGDGTCDDKAMLSVDGGIAFQITLH